MLTAYGDVELAVKALKNGAFDFVAQTVGQPDVATKGQGGLSECPQTVQGRRLRWQRGVGDDRRTFARYAAPH